MTTPAPLTLSLPCPTCNGRGMVNSPTNDLAVRFCEDCNGKGDAHPSAFHLANEWATCDFSLDAATGRYRLHYRVDGLRMSFVDPTLWTLADVRANASDAAWDAVEVTP